MTKLSIALVFALGCTPEREPLPLDHPANPAAQEPPWTAPDGSSAPAPSPAPPGGGHAGHGGHEHHGGGR